MVGERYEQNPSVTGRTPVCRTRPAARSARGSPDRARQASTTDGRTRRGSSARESCRRPRSRAVWRTWRAARRGRCKRTSWPLPDGTASTPPRRVAANRCDGTEAIFGRVRRAKRQTSEHRAEAAARDHSQTRSDKRIRYACSPGSTSATKSRYWEFSTAVGVSPGVMHASHAMCCTKGNRNLDRLILSGLSNSTRTVRSARHASAILSGSSPNSRLHARTNASSKEAWSRCCPATQHSG